MATIYPPANGVSYNREELLANTVPVYRREQPLSNSQLNALRDESKRRGRPLSDAERDAVLGLKAEQRPSVRLVEVDQ